MGKYISASERVCIVFVTFHTIFAISWIIKIVFHTIHTFINFILTYFLDLPSYSRQYKILFMSCPMTNIPRFPKWSLQKWLTSFGILKHTYLGEPGHIILSLWAVIVYYLNSWPCSTFIDLCIQSTSSLWLTHSIVRYALHSDL